MCDFYIIFRETKQVILINTMPIGYWCKKNRNTDCHELLCKFGWCHPGLLSDMQAFQIHYLTFISLLGHQAGVAFSYTMVKHRKIDV